MKVYHRVWLFNNLPSFEDLTRTKSNKVHLKMEEKKFFPGDCLIDIDRVFKKIIKKEHKFEKCLFFKFRVRVRPTVTDNNCLHVPPVNCTNAIYHLPSLKISSFISNCFRDFRLTKWHFKNQNLEKKSTTVSDVINPKISILFFHYLYIYCYLFFLSL